MVQPHVVVRVIIVVGRRAVWIVERKGIVHINKVRHNLCNVAVGAGCRHRGGLPDEGATAGNRKLS